jgi:outer membrane protein OmpA-like peptidoglycan-associated protein
MQKLRPTTIALAALAAGALALGGCASEKYVNAHVAVVDAKAQTTQDQVAAQQAALQAHDARLGQLDQSTRDALERANAAGKLAEGKFVYSTVLSDDSVKFPLHSAKLSTEDQTRLMDLAQKLKADNKNVYLEIQGHTDSKETGKMRLGQERAEAVRQFMYQQGVALSRMATISYADQQPIAPNTTRAGRAQNRCAVVVVLA